jgi:hypothetical protein
VQRLAGTVLHGELAVPSTGRALAKQCGHLGALCRRREVGQSASDDLLAVAAEQSRQRGIGVDEDAVVVEDAAGARQMLEERADGGVIGCAPSSATLSAAARFEASAAEVAVRFARHAAVRDAMTMGS